MQHIHGREHLSANTLVRVDCDTQCNVLVMDDHHYRRYCSGVSYRYHGGFYTHFPAGVRVPHSGFWNVVLDLGGGSARIRYDISYVSPAGTL